MRRVTPLLVAGLLGAGALAPAHAAVTTAPQWQIPAPALSPFHVQAPKPGRPNCHVSDIRGTAHTTRSTYAVLGVVRLHAHGCLIHVAQPIVALLDANGHPLKVAIRTASAKNRGDNPTGRSGTSAISWGFAWRGSWCGAQAIYVRIELRGGRKLRVPMPGGQPACKTGGGPAVLVRGSFGDPGQSVQAAPPEWASLTAKLHVNQTTHGSTLRGMSVDFKNGSPDAVTLDPCPRYTIFLESTHAAASPDGSPGPELDGCPAVPTVVSGHGTISIHLSDTDFNRKDFGPVGTKVKVMFAIAGLDPSAVRTRLV